MSTSLRVLGFAGFLLGGTLLGGCGMGQAKKDAEQVITRHFQAIATNGYEAAAADYGPQAFQKVTREKWMGIQPKIAAKLGDYVSHTTKMNKLRMVGGKSGSTTVTLTCQVTYSKQTVAETFTLLKADMDRDFKIIGHLYNSADPLFQ